MEGKDLTGLTKLTPDVLEIIVVDGETLLASQLTASLAGDQRGFTFAGLCLGAATAALGASLALLTADKPNATAAMISAVFALLQTVAAALGVYSARPQQLFVPGNSPVNWLPENWDVATANAMTVSQARLEQASILQSMIDDNAGAAVIKARIQRWAFAFSMAGAIGAAVAILAIIA